MDYLPNLQEALTMLWPLIFLLITLVCLWRVEKEMKPVVTGVITGLATNAAQKALLYAMGALYFAAASLQALGEVSTSFGWVHVAAFAKVLQPGVVAIIAYVTKPPAISQANPTPPPAPQPAAQPPAPPAP